jgi:hypothetical protein
MNDKPNQTACSIKCDEEFKACLSGRENESVCRMKRVQCDCGCTIR